MMLYRATACTCSDGHRSISDGAVRCWECFGTTVKFRLATADELRQAVEAESIYATPQREFGADL
jgi:hypothetical protein